MSVLRWCVLFLALLGSQAVVAGGTGPTHPQKARQHPLDSSEPRQEVIERPRGGPRSGAPALPSERAPGEADRPPLPDREEGPAVPDERAGERRGART
ncbi:hypothetical protein CXK94_01110 [Stutzerimonas stutzeri]|uniref:Uncharacterized protein n=1 Tax=Stutzerimonas stutzeri TaxID=316 RepID=A0A2N8T8X0_STUST|nr:hypothetical protein CXK94_01110 [Stutzerimonas stutzeri]